jgi:hypothetical protein
MSIAGLPPLRSLDVDVFEFKTFELYMQALHPEPSTSPTRTFDSHAMSLAIDGREAA